MLNFFKKYKLKKRLYIQVEGDFFGFFLTKRTFYFIYSMLFLIIIFFALNNILNYYFFIHLDNISKEIVETGIEIIKQEIPVSIIKIDLESSYDSTKYFF